MCCHINFSYFDLFFFSDVFLNLEAIFSCKKNANDRDGNFKIQFLAVGKYHIFPCPPKIRSLGIDTIFDAILIL